MLSQQTIIFPHFKPMHDFLEAIEKLHPSARLDFARKNFKELIQQRSKFPENNPSFDLVTVLDQLPLEERDAFLEEHKELIKTEIILLNILSLIPHELRIKYARENAEKIHGGMWLAKIIKLLPVHKNDRLALINNFVNLKIKDSFALVPLLELLPDSERLNFATNHRNVLRFGDQINSVLNLLPETSHYAFVEDLITHTNLCTNELVYLLGGLPNNMILYFSRKYATESIESDDRKIKAEKGGQYGVCKDYLLNDFIKILPKQLRLQFAIEFTPKITTCVVNMAVILKNFSLYEQFQFALGVEWCLTATNYVDNFNYLFQHKKFELENTFFGDYISLLHKHLELNKPTPLLGYFSALLKKTPEGIKLTKAFKLADVSTDEWIQVMNQAIVGIDYALTRKVKTEFAKYQETQPCLAALSNDISTLVTHYTSFFQPQQTNALEAETKEENKKTPPYKRS